MTFCYRRVKTRNKSLRSRTTEVIRIKSAGIELEDLGIIIFRFRLGAIACTGKSIQFVISNVVGCLPSLIVCRHLPATATSNYFNLQHEHIDCINNERNNASYNHISLFLSC